MYQNVITGLFHGVWTSFFMNFSFVERGRKEIKLKKAIIHLVRTEI